MDVSRTGYTGDLGYEVWIPAEAATNVWDRLMAVGVDWAIRPAGMLALDVTRLEAGLILLEVDYTSARHAMNPEQNYSPYEIGLGRLVSLDKADYVGRRALAAEARRGGPARRLVGLTLDWYGIEGLYDAQGIPPAISPTVDRSRGPGLRGRPPGRQGHLARLEPDPQAGHRAGFRPGPRSKPVGSQVEVEWTVEGRRGRVPAVVTDAARSSTWSASGPDGASWTR